MIMPFAQVCFWAFQRRSNFWKIFEKFSLVPPLPFFRKCGFGLPGENCHNLAIRAPLEPPYSPKSCPVFALLVHTYYRIMPFAPACFWAFQARANFFAICEKFPVVPSLHFLENAGFGWQFEKNCLSLAIRVLLEPLLVPQLSPVFAL